MIVKDEEKNLGNCLSSIKNYVKQIVIVDTGSNDKTIKIAQDFGAEVYHYDWADHFARARNESIKYAKEEWIFWMDADEILDPKSISELKLLTRNNTKDYYYNVKITSNNQFENKILYSDASRLFPNNTYLKVSEDRAWNFLKKMYKENLEEWGDKLLYNAKS